MTLTNSDRIADCSFTRVQAYPLGLSKSIKKEVEKMRDKKDILDNAHRAGTDRLLLEVAIDIRDVLARLEEKEVNLSEQKKGD